MGLILSVMRNFAKQVFDIAKIYRLHCLVDRAKTDIDRAQNDMASGKLVVLKRL